jgi:hypothetical protein
MSSQRQGVLSTKIASNTAPSPPSLTTPSKPKQDIYIKTYETYDTVFSEQTSEFPHVSSRGNCYHMILYHSDINSIWVQPSKNKTKGKLILARTRALT